MGNLMSRSTQAQLTVSIFTIEYPLSSPYEGHSKYLMDGRQELVLAVGRTLFQEGEERERDGLRRAVHRRHAHVRRWKVDQVKNLQDLRDQLRP